jgi:predicted solute-binding protein
VRVSVVEFLNAAPLYWGLKHGRHPDDWEVSYDIPSACARRLAEGGCDVGLIPSIEFARQPDLVLAAPLCVAADEEVTSVLLLARGRLEDLRTVHLDAASRTSRELVRILLAERCAVSPAFTGSSKDPAILEDGEASLIIGDPAMTLGELPGAVHRHDLAALWRLDTGLPFVFAVWAARRSSFTREVRDTLEASHAFGVKRLEAIVDVFSRSLGLGPQTVRRYLTHHLHYAMGAAEKKSLARFFALALKEDIPDDRLAVPATSA